ncbi:MAG TPA: SIS domain-containing protein [Thermomicrobiales bacterium]|nr:SIS domain-containing protein [Thermomicrobiales bacterium]
MMTAPAEMRTVLAEYRAGLQAVLDALRAEDVQRFADYLHDAYERGKFVFIIGNGGSAATASHMACDLGKTVLGRDIDAPRRRFRALALTDNMPLVTAWGNDVEYETVFAQQLRNLATAGDLLVVITGSGNSPNVVAAVRAARELGVTAVGLLGFDGGLVKGLLQHAVVAESDNYGHIEDAHMMLTHLVTAYFKRALECAAAVGR